MVATPDVLTCGICLEDSKDPLNLPCGHSFCDGCLGEWRSRYGVEQEMRKKCPICRARIPPSKEMVETLEGLRAQKQKLEDDNDTSSEEYIIIYHSVCHALAQAEERVGADWDGVTVLQGNTDNPGLTMPEYIEKAIAEGNIKSILRWINADRTVDRVHAKSDAKRGGIPSLSLASMCGHLTLMTLLLQLGANVDNRNSQGLTAISSMFSDERMTNDDVHEMVRLLLSWGASFFTGEWCSREYCVSSATYYDNLKLANLIGSELGGRRCEVVNSASRPELNGKTCVADEFLPDSNEYKVTLETKSKEVLVLGSDNLKRRDRTTQDCGYYIEFKNGRTIRHDFDSSEDCKAFLAALNKGEGQPAVTREAEARAEQAAAELLAEMGLDDSSNDLATSGNQAKKSKKKKGGKGKKKK